MSLNVEKLRNPDLKNWATEHLNKAARMFYLGAPLLSDVDKIVTIANMKNGSYTIAAQPDIPRNVTVTHATVAAGTDTLGKLLVTGTNIDDVVISEEITPVADSTVAGLLAFKTITSIAGSGWVIAGGNDTITVGIGDLLGLPIIINADELVLLGVHGTANVAPTVAHDAASISKCTVNLATGTYDGSKKAFVWVVE
jgi:hypothetical protein